jgi:hypothetical protein
MPKLHCELESCQAPFTPVRGWQKYCSKPCKKEADRVKRDAVLAAAGAVTKGKNAAAVALGRLGGIASQAKRTPEQRSAIARKGGLARAAKVKNGGNHEASIN